MRNLFRVLSLPAILALAVGDNSGFDALVDYALTLVNSKINGLGDSAVWLPLESLGLPSDVTAAQVYNLSSLHRQGSTVTHRQEYPEKVTVEVEIGLSQLVVYLKLKESFITGGANLHINDNSVKVAIDMTYYDQISCELQLTSADVKLRGLDIDVWGLTLIGDKVAKSKIKAAYDAKVDGLEKQASDYIKSFFGKSLPDVITFCKIKA